MNNIIFGTNQLDLVFATDKADVVRFRVDPIQASSGGTLDSTGDRIVGLSNQDAIQFDGVNLAAAQITTVYDSNLNATTLNIDIDGDGRVCVPTRVPTRWVASSGASSRAC